MYNRKTRRHKPCALSFLLLLLTRLSRSCFDIDLVLEVGGEPLDVGDCFPLELIERDLSRRTISLLDDPPEGALRSTLKLAASAISTLLMIIEESIHNIYLLPSSDPE